jgi:glucose-6-phosphate isomerase
MSVTPNPVTATIDARGELSPATSTVRRHLSHMRGMYRDAGAEAAALRGGDPLVYEVYQYDMPPSAGELIPCTTVLHPGRIGEEFFMTKGHFHQRRDRAEVYYGLQGEGRLVLARDGEAEVVALTPGTVAYVPPFWAHRTVNVGETPLVFLAVYHGDAGHDYGTIETEGFPQVVLWRDGAVSVVARDEA